MFDITNLSYIYDTFVNMEKFTLLRFIKIYTRLYAQKLHNYCSKALNQA